ncbi:3-hydroxybutyryl-CoA dehydrogenase [Paenibacillus xylaniclasticus]|uniref:3-hydroxybutyryl-CoA dehydrogenase n=1 Tax=Paenibacillus xylaniclasticus TaxID=588083 RepID=UPI000FD93EF9|nr:MULTISPECIES: 3-hydroxybutyryl-CoA dehydrogenase [Paenibacillus]GFN31678.1 3-hydroxybutyryl-CoA dehydrogenase [Paenibacillus curdlanolyticus]
MNIEHVLVIGAGQMGSGIAETLLSSGYTVTLYDIYEAAIERGAAAIRRGLTRAVAKGRMTEEEQEAALLRLTCQSSLETAAEQTNLVIEAAPESLSVKQQLFRTLDASCAAGVILATNTSSLSITELASATKRPDKVIGMHFMNPVPLMPLVEIIRGLSTSDDTFEGIVMVAKSLGKTPLAVRDLPGFVSNRVLMPMINEAVYAVYEGVASPETVDSIMRLGMNHPMGPLALADLIGLDTCLSIMESLHTGFCDSKYRPCPLLRQYVKAGWLGKKSGRGFYVYE